MPKLGFTRMGNPQGYPIALIHGWGFDSSFLYPVAQLFTDRDVYLIDLPGYGKSVHLTSIASDFTRTIHLLINTIPYGADVIAWSFGTLYTLHALTEITNLSNDEDSARALKRHMHSQPHPSSPSWQQDLPSGLTVPQSHNGSSKQNLQGELNEFAEFGGLTELVESGEIDTKEQSYHSILDYCLNRDQHRTYFRSLVTICGSPRFPSDPNWQGMNAIKILKCNTKMTHHHIDLIMGLFRRMMRKTAINQEDRAYIKQTEENEQQVSYDVLQEGIKVVTLMDERPAWQNLTMPSLHLFGALDPLVPCSLASLFKTPMHSSFVFPHSTHTPYLSEPKSFKKVIRAFFDKVTHLAHSKSSEHSEHCEHKESSEIGWAL